MTKEQFVQKFYPAAVAATAGTTLLPEVAVVQAALETGWGTSLHSKSNVNNFFGLKAGASWQGKVISSSTWEYISGVKTRVYGTGKIYPNTAAALQDGAKSASLFRVFDTPADGIKGWVEFLQAFSRYRPVLAQTTPTAQFQALKDAGYATDPNYVSKLTSIYNGLTSLFQSTITSIADNSGAFFFTDRPSIGPDICNN